MTDESEALYLRQKKKRSCHFVKKKKNKELDTRVQEVPIISFWCALAKLMPQYCNKTLSPPLCTVVFWVWFIGQRLKMNLIALADKIWLTEKYTMIIPLLWKTWLWKSDTGTALLLTHLSRCSYIFSLVKMNSGIAFTEKDTCNSDLEYSQN